MADYIFTTDADDEAAITRWLEKHPEQSVTVQQLLRRIIRQWLNHIVADWREERRQRLKDAYDSASAQDRATIDQILGL